jgi:hypothetical protein
VQGGQHADVQECEEQQDADIADGQQVHNLSLRAHLYLGRRGHDGWGNTVLVLSRCTTVQLSARPGYGRIATQSAGVAEWQTQPA